MLNGQTLCDRVFRVDYQEDCILHCKALKRVWHACSDQECMSCLLNLLVGSFGYSIEAGSITASCLDSHLGGITHEHDDLFALGQFSSFIHGDTHTWVVLFPHHSKKIATNIEGRSFVPAWEFKRHSRCRINNSERCNEPTDQSR